MESLHPRAVPLVSFRTGKQKGWVLHNAQFSAEAIEEQDGSIFMLIWWDGADREKSMTFANWTEAREYLSQDHSV